MKYVIEFDLPDNETVLHNIKTAWVGWNVWGYSGNAYAKPKQPEREKGEWKYSNHYGNRYRVCPFCKMERKDDLSTGWHFCPNCGSEMRDEG